MNYKILALLLLVLIGCDRIPHPKEQIFLHDNWEFTQNSKNSWLPATVPGVVHTDLLANNLIPHPWVGTNEDSVQWIENESWIYRTTFDLTNTLFEREGIDLVCEGLDTFAEVFINDSLVFTANNMFRKWRINIKPFSTIGQNKLKVIFKSPIKALIPLLDSLTYNLPASNESVPVRVGPYVRKAPYHFGWDWSPRLVTAGIWRPVYLEFWDKSRIENVQIIQRSLSDNLAELSGNIEILSTSKTNGIITLMGIDQEITLTSGINIISIDFTIQNPKKWWPNGWGEPNLYKIPISLSIKDKVIDERVQSIGLRTIELVHKKDSIGKSFYFKVNGEPIFAKGANYIPQSHFLPDINEEDYRNLISDAKSANMNMLRVWGGGIYENDLFYQLCDENGILVWQDFIFANTMYPGDSAFLNNVEAEIEDNVKRLRNHPSIAHWNGNNEIDVAWHNWGWQKQFKYSAEDSTIIWNDYLRLFHTLIPEKLKELDPQRSYTTTSPLSNSGIPDNFNHSSMHYWGVWHGQDRFEDYRNNVGRFMGEYGFQSFPHIKTIQYFADSSEWHTDSDVMKHHQKSYVGNSMITQHLENYFDTPDSFEDFVIKSQQTQTVAMKIAIDAHRLKKGHCWGTLYWQFNDCWPGPSWSSRDVYGRKKLLHQNLPIFFAPVALIPEKKEDNLKIWLVNDLPNAINITAQLTLMDKNNKKIKQEDHSLTSVKNDIQQLWEISLSEIQPKPTRLDLEIIDANDSIIFKRNEQW